LAEAFCETRTCTSARDPDDLIPDGVLGYDIFAHAVVTIDFVKNTMQIQDPAFVDPDALQGIHVLADLGRGTAVVPAKVQDTSVPVVLETAVPEALVLPYGMVERNGFKLYPDNQGPGTVLLPPGGLTEFSGTNLYGQFSTNCWRSEVVTLGPISYTRPPTCVAFGIEEGQGVLGLDFLDRFEKIVFDFSRAGVIFVPRTYG
jgi:hypothetical protein